MTGTDPAAGAVGSVAMPEVTVVIVNYNAGAWLQRCLDALRAQSVGSFDIIVVDNASTDDSLALAGAALADVRVRLVSVDVERFQIEFERVS